MLAPMVRLDAVPAPRVLPLAFRPFERRFACDACTAHARQPGPCLVCGNGDAVIPVRPSVHGSDADR